VTHLLNTSGNVIESYKYDAFGAPAIYDANGTELSSSAYSNRFLFAGREYANAFGFYEYRARAYNPTLGRFMSEDPRLFDAGDYNLFRYCHNDPIDFTDPMGLDGAPTYSPRQTSQEREETVSAPQAVWERQKKFDRSNGVIDAVSNGIVSGVRQWWKWWTAPQTEVATPTIVAAAPIEEAPAALVGLGRLIAKALRGSEGETTTTALSTIRVTHPGEAFYRYESANPAFSRVTSTGGVTAKTFAAPASDGVVPRDLRISSYKLPHPDIPRPIVRDLFPPPGTAIVGPRSVIAGTKNEVMFPFGY
jgi:RHS repeat-associated protein